MGPLKVVVMVDGREVEVEELTAGGVVEATKQCEAILAKLDTMHL